MAADDAYEATLAELRQRLAGPGKWRGVPELLDTLDRFRRRDRPRQPTLEAPAGPVAQPTLSASPPRSDPTDERSRERHADVIVDA